MLTPLGKSHAKVWHLATQLGIANTHLYIFKQLQDAQSGLYNREMYKSLDFWHYTLNAHIQAAMVHLCRLYDSHGETLHLIQFLKEISDRCLLPQELRQKKTDLAFLQKPDPSVAKLRKWRNKLIAHSDYNLAIYGHDNFLQCNPVTLAEIQGLVDFGFDLLERWKQHYQCKSDLPRFASGKDDYQFVLQSLKTTIKNLATTP